MNAAKCDCGRMKVDGNHLLPPACASCPDCKTQITRGASLPAIPHEIVDGKCRYCGRTEKMLKRVLNVRIVRGAA